MKAAVAFLILLAVCTASVPQEKPKVVAPKQAQALVVGQHWVGLWWQESNCPTCTFNVYRGTATGVCNWTNGTPPTPYATGIATLPTQAAPWMDTNVTAGQTLVYAASAVLNGGESTCSSEVQVTVPTSPNGPSSVQGAAH